MTQDLDQQIVDMTRILALLQEARRLKATGAMIIPSVRQTSD